MDFQGQKLAEQLCLYIICAAGAVAFLMGWVEGSFALMMKVRPPFGSALPMARLGVALAAGACHGAGQGAVRAIATMEVRSALSVQSKTLFRRCCGME